MPQVRILSLGPLSELSYLTTLISFSLVFFDFLAFSYASIAKNAVRTLAVKVREIELFTAFR